MEITKGENANLAGMEPRCPKCSAKVEFVMLSDSAAGIAAMCANDHRFPLYKGLDDCHVFFRTPVLRCPCCESENVTLEQNEIARWVACHNPKCGLTHHVSTNPELAQFFPAPTPPLDVPSVEEIIKLLGNGWKGFKLGDMEDLMFVVGQIRLAIQKFYSLRRHIASPAPPEKRDEWVSVDPNGPLPESDVLVEWCAASTGFRCYGEYRGDKKMWNGHQFHSIWKFSHWRKVEPLPAPPQSGKEGQP